MSRRASLVPLAARPEHVSTAERELAEFLERLTALEAETAALSESLGRFRDERRVRLGAAEEELFAAKRLEERVLRLRREAEQWAAGPPAAVRRVQRAARALPPLPPRANDAPSAAPWLSLKDLYRTLARKLHPDLAEGDAERARRSELLVRVNAAYAREDRVLLELLHEQAASESAVLDAGEPSREARATHAERRLATIAPMVAALERGLARLRSSSLFRDADAARRKAKAGGDFFSESLYGLRKASKAATDAALGHADALDEMLRAFRGRSNAPPAGGVARTAARRDSSQLLRRAASLRDRARTPAARRLAAELARAVKREPWQVVLSLFALFGEASQAPPPGLSTLAVARERYASVCEAWPSAPAFEKVLSRLPTHLELGLCAYPKRLVFGVQVKSAEHLAGIELALESPDVAEIARAVLGALGPAERCSRCRRGVFLVHLFRARGPDDIHALVCPVCARVHRSYRSFGAPEGLEALAPHARALGLVAEQPVLLGRTVIVLEFLPAERRSLTAKALLERLAASYLDDISEDLAVHCHLATQRRILAPVTPIRREVPVRLTVARTAPVSAKELEQALRARARTRFQNRP